METNPHGSPYPAPRFAGAGARLMALSASSSHALPRWRPQVQSLLKLADERGCISVRGLLEGINAAELNKLRI